MNSHDTKIRIDHLPRADSSELFETVHNENVGVPPVEGELLRVVIVDDDTSTRLFLRAVLEQCRQFNVVGEAGDGETAIKLVGRLQPDIVLLDLSMPRGDGSSALGGLLRVAPSTRVIVVSGMSPTMGEPLLNEGATAFVPKGISPSELLDRLEIILDRELTMEGLSLVEEGHGRVLSLISTTDPSRSANYRAIVCEDDSGARHRITQVLEDCDLVVTAETNTPPTLLALVDLAQPDLVVLDLWLKGAIDTAVVAEIRVRSPHSVVIVYTEFADWRDRALGAGASAFVLKPNLGELAERIRLLCPTPHP